MLTGNKVVDLCHSCGVVVVRRLHRRHVGKGRLVGRAGEQAEEVLEVVVARRAANQEDGGNLDLRGMESGVRVGGAGKLQEQR